MNNKNNFFKRDFEYYYINNFGKVILDFEMDTTNTLRYDIANYCTNKELMEQRALYESLHRLLWRFSMEFDDNENEKAYYILFDKNKSQFIVNKCDCNYFGTIGFSNEEIANYAINCIIKPFIKNNPKFILYNKENRNGI